MYDVAGEYERRTKAWLRAEEAAGVTWIDLDGRFAKCKCGAMTFTTTAIKYGNPVRLTRERYDEWVCPDCQRKR